MKSKKSEDNVFDNVMWFLWILFIFSMVLHSYTVFTTIQGHSLHNATVAIQVVGASTPSIDPIHLVAHPDDHVVYQVVADDADGDDLFYDDNCSFFDVNRTTGIIDFVVTSNIRNITYCLINVTDLASSDSTLAKIEISVCGDDYCNTDETHISCPSDCPLDPATTTSNTNFNVPAEVVSPILFCTPEYECTAWSGCRFDGYSYRSCILLNDCTSSSAVTRMKCTYNLTVLETKLASTSEKIDSDPVSAAKEIDFVVKSKLKDLTLLKTLLKLDPSINLDIDDQAVDEYEMYLLYSDQLLSNLGIDSEINKDELKTINSQLLDITRQLPEIKLVSEQTQDFFVPISTITGESDFTGVVTDYKLVKTYSSYEISNTEVSDIVETRSLVEIDVIINSRQPELKFIEEVPKSAAPNVSYLRFDPEDDIEIIEDDPIFSWTISNVKSGDNIKLNYVVLGYINASDTALARRNLSDAELVVANSWSSLQDSCTTTLYFIKKLVLLLLFVSVFTLILTNPYLSSTFFKKSNKLDKTAYKINTYAYFSLFILALVFIIVDIICFSVYFIREIILINLLLLITFLLRR